MTLYNITVDKSAVHGTLPAKVRQVQNPTASSVTAPAFAPGEPVLFTANSQYVTQVADAKPTTSDLIAGIAEDFSTESGGNDGIVHVSPIDQKAIYLCNVLAGTDISTQSKYNAFVGRRVTLHKSAANNTGVFTVNVTDGSTNGLIIENNDIVANPGKIAFSFRGACIYNA